MYQHLCIVVMEVGMKGRLRSSRLLVESSGNSNQFYCVYAIYYISYHYYFIVGFKCSRNSLGFVCLGHLLQTVGKTVTALHRINLYPRTVSESLDLFRIRSCVI